MEEKYTELRAALEAGPTPGPWSGRTGGLDAGLATDCAIHTWERCIAQITDNPLNQRDMAYIAAANPKVIRALLAERDALREALERAGAWVADVPHGDNCFVSNHYEGDPGNQCNCGADSIVEAIFDALAQEQGGSDVDR